jgi:hypothetical protein
MVRFRAIGRARPETSGAAKGHFPSNSGVCRDVLISHGR